MDSFWSRQILVTVFICLGGLLELVLIQYLLNKTVTNPKAKKLWNLKVTLQDNTFFSFTCVQFFCMVSQDIEIPTCQVSFCFITFQRFAPELDNILLLEDSMYFVESSGNSTIHPRFTCCIESAAKHHPNATIYLFMTSETLDTRSVMHLLRHYKNIKIQYINVGEFLRGKISFSWICSLTCHPDW